MAVIVGLSHEQIKELAGELPMVFLNQDCQLQIPQGRAREYWQILWPWWQLNAGVPAKLVTVLGKRRLTLAVAESATGGLVCSMLTDVPGASQVLAGGVITYTNKTKEKLLKLDDVPASGVSPDLTLSMARQVRIRLNSDLGLAITGVLGPSIPGDGLAVGQVYIAVAAQRFEGVYPYFFSGDRRIVKTSAARASLNLVLAALGRWQHE